MKIGILTQPLQNNYGGLLQNYALQQVLKRMGHEVETIDQGGLLFSKFHKFLALLNNMIKYIFSPNKIVLKYEPTDEEWSIIRKNTNDFIEKNIKRTSVVHHAEEFKILALQNKYDAFVVGSDQCWRPRYNPFLLNMFLKFIENQDGIVRVAYAASFGSDKWEMSPEMTKKCSALAKMFDLITVREASGIELCKKHLGVDATHVLDPTMLLDKEDYIKLVESENLPQSPGNLFYYILDPSDEKKTLIEDIAERNGLKPFTVMPKYQAENRTKEDVKKRLDDCVFPSVTSWLRAFMDAEMVVVDSFHGAVFSVIFNKTFWVIENSHRGNARFVSLLHLLGLEDRLLDLNKLHKIEINKDIDWCNVNGIIEMNRNRCKNILFALFNC